MSEYTIPAPGQTSLSMIQDSHLDAISGGAIIFAYPAFVAGAKWGAGLTLAVIAIVEGKKLV